MPAWQGTTAGVISIFPIFSYKALMEKYCRTPSCYPASQQTVNYS